jgi:hypothetical protein
MENEERVNEEVRSGNKGISTQMWVLVIGLLVLGAIGLWIFSPNAAPLATADSVIAAEGTGSMGDYSDNSNNTNYTTTGTGGVSPTSGGEREVFADEISGELSITVVEFKEGWDSHGKMVQSGTRVIGPAIIKEDPNRADAIAVLVGAEYVLSCDSVVWLYRANNPGLRSQYMFFNNVREIASPTGK